MFYRKNNLKINLHGHVLARGNLTCLLNGPRSQKSCPPLAKRVKCKAWPYFKLEVMNFEFR